MLEALGRGVDAEEVHARTGIDPWFLRELRALAPDPDEPFAASARYRAVDTCAAEFAAETPYYYSALGARRAPARGRAAATGRAS